MHAVHDSTYSPNNKLKTLAKYYNALHNKVYELRWSPIDALPISSATASCFLIDRVHRLIYNICTSVNFVYHGWDKKLNQVFVFKHLFLLYSHLNCLNKGPKKKLSSVRLLTQM